MTNDGISLQHHSLQLTGHLLTVSHAIKSGLATTWLTSGTSGLVCPTCGHMTRGLAVIAEPGVCVVAVHLVNLRVTVKHDKAPGAAQPDLSLDPR